MTSEIWNFISTAEAEKDPQESLKILQKALRMAENSKDPFLIAACLLRMAFPYKILGNHKKELECLSKTEEIAKNLPVNPRTGALLSNLAVTLRQLGEYKRSLQLLEKALLMFETAPEKGAILCNMGNCYYELNEYQNAAAYYVKAKKIFKKTNYPHQIGICLQNIGNTLRELNKFKKSLKYYKKAYKIFSMYNLPLQSAHVLWNQAIVYDELNQFKKALVLYDTVISVLTKENQYIDLAKIYNDKALTLRKLTRYKEALTLLRKALSLFEKYNMPVEVIETKRNIAGLYRNMDFHEKALRELYSARKELKALGKHASVADVEWEIANVYASADQPVKAVTYYDKVLHYFTKNEMSICAAQAMRDKANVVKDLGDYDEALALYFEAERIFKENNLVIELASTRNNLGELFMTLNHLEDAEKMFKKAKALYVKGGIEIHAAEADFNLAAVLYKFSKYEDALSILQRIEPIFLKHHQLVSVAETQINKAVILGELNRYKEALSLFESARTYVDGLLSHQLQIDLNESVLLLEQGTRKEVLPKLREVSQKAEKMNLFTTAYKGLWALGHAYEQEGQLKKAYHYMKKSLEVVEKIRGDVSPHLLKMSFFSGTADIYEDVTFFFHRMGLNRTAFSVLQKMKGRTLTEQMMAAERGYSDIPSRISALYTRLQRESSSYTKRQNILKKISSLEDHYAEMVTKGELSQSSIDLILPHVKSIQNSLNYGEALLEYVFDEDTLLLFLLKPKFFKTISIDRENLDKTIYEYLSRIRLRRPLKNVSEKLYTVLMAPVQPYLKGTNTLRIVPYKRLYLFPFHALHHNRFLAEIYQVVYHPAGRLAHRKDSPHESMLIVGNPGNNLKGAEKECKAIYTMVKESGRAAALLLGKDATKERFYELYPDYDVIHAACHGVYNSNNPLRSGLKLHKGIVTALEMHHLTLKGKLLVLGACGSGSVSVGKGSELLGITRALLCAGSSFVIASLWETPDTASVLFWKAFYKTLSTKKTVSRALQSAQQAMISSKFGHPYFWAGYRGIQ